MCFCVILFFIYILFVEAEMNFNKNYKNNYILLIAVALPVSCVHYPPNKNLSIDYEKIQNSILCHVIDAWKFEYGYHKRTLGINPNPPKPKRTLGINSNPPKPKSDDDKNNKLLLQDAVGWNVKLNLVHERQGVASLGGTEAHTDKNANWAKVLNFGITPSTDLKYSFTSNPQLKIPQGVFTDEDLKTTKSNANDFKFSKEFAGTCDAKYLDLSQMGINQHFKTFIKGFSPEENGEVQKYVNLNFDSVGKLVVSFEPTFTYELVPHKAVFLPKANYTDTVTIDLDITRVRLQRTKLPKAPETVKLETERENFCRLKKFKTNAEYITCLKSGVSKKSNVAGVNQEVNVIPTKPEKGITQDVFRQDRENLFEDISDNINVLNQ